MTGSRIEDIGSETVNKEGSAAVNLAADIVSAYVANNSMPYEKVSGFLTDIHATIINLTGPLHSQAPVIAKNEPVQKPAESALSSVARSTPVDDSEISIHEDPPMGHSSPIPSIPDNEPLVPAVEIKKSVGKNVIICLECGKRFKTLLRHLRTSHDLTPDAYKRKWKLPHDYPIVAPEYSAFRQTLAKTTGLGRKS